MTAVEIASLYSDSNPTRVRSFFDALDVAMRLGRHPRVRIEQIYGTASYRVLLEAEGAE